MKRRSLNFQRILVLTVLTQLLFMEWKTLWMLWMALLDSNIRSTGLLNEDLSQPILAVSSGTWRARYVLVQCRTPSWEIKLQMRVWSCTNLDFADGTWTDISCKFPQLKALREVRRISAFVSSRQEFKVTRTCLRDTLPISFWWSISDKSMYAAQEECVDRRPTLYPLANLSCSLLVSNYEIITDYGKQAAKPAESHRALRGNSILFLALFHCKEGEKTNARYSRRGWLGLPELTVNRGSLSPAIWLVPCWREDKMNSWRLWN